MTDTIDRLRGMLVTCGKHGTHGIVDMQAVQDAITEILHLRDSNEKLRSQEAERWNQCEELRQKLHAFN